MCWVTFVHFNTIVKGQVVNRTLDQWFDSSSGGIYPSCRLQTSLKNCFRAQAPEWLTVARQESFQTEFIILTLGQLSRMRWKMAKGASVPSETLWRAPKLLWLSLPLVWDGFHLMKCELIPIVLFSLSIKGLPSIKEGHHTATLTQVMSSNIIGSYNLIVRSLQNGVLSSYNPLRINWIFFCCVIFALRAEIPCRLHFQP